MYYEMLKAYCLSDEVYSSFVQPKVDQMKSTMQGAFV